MLTPQDGQIDAAQALCPSSQVTKPSNVTIDGDIVASRNHERLAALELPKDRPGSDLDDGAAIAGPLQIQPYLGQDLSERLEVAATRLAIRSGCSGYDFRRRPGRTVAITASGSSAAFPPGSGVMAAVHTRLTAIRSGACLCRSQDRRLDDHRIPLRHGDPAGVGCHGPAGPQVWAKKAQSSCSDPSTPIPLKG
jgi:hypothetical protein